MNESVSKQNKPNQPKSNEQATGALSSLQLAVLCLSDSSSSSASTVEFSPEVQYVYIVVIITELEIYGVVTVRCTVRCVCVWYVCAV